MQQVETLGQPIEDLPRRERLRARGCELDREGQVVEAGAEPEDLIASLEPGALAEEGYGLGRGERRHLVLDLALDAQALAARDEESEVGAGADKTR